MLATVVNGEFIENKTRKAGMVRDTVRIGTCGRSRTGYRICGP